jgi:hypothetical protein
VPGARRCMVRYNRRVPKRYCTSRAEWRLQPGKPAEALSPHYRLDCDFGTGVITCWEEGGSEPIYVCESHAKQLGQPRKQVKDIRIITPPSERRDHRINAEDRTDFQEVAAATPKAVSLAAALTPPAAPVKTAVDRAAIQEVVEPPEKPSLPAAPKTAPAAETEAARDQTDLQEIAGTSPEAPPAAPDAPNATARIPSDAKIARTSESPVRPPARDLAYGNPAKAMVDEAIWNLATGNYQVYKAAIAQGKSAAAAAEAAGGQLAMVQRKISDYTLKLEHLLSESKAAIAVGESIDKPLEQAVLDIIGNGAMSDSEKDAAVQQLGVIQEWVKQGLQGNITALQANQIALAIGDRLNWGGAADVPEEFKPVYRRLYGNLKSAIRGAVPEAQTLHERLTNLYAAKSELEIP